jgi:hypothetical protein
MIDFNDTLLCSFLLSGYKYILYYHLDHFAVIVPCNEKLETGENSYVLPIEDEQVYEMADGVDEFSFYVLL